MKKPCIQCGNECEILPVQLGDTFTLAYLRVCGPECMFLVAYDYLYEIGYHKQFRGALYEKQDEEDKKERDQWIKEVTDEAIRMMGEHFAANPKMLSTPAPDCVLKMFSDCPPLPASCGVMRFTRPSKEDRLRWQAEHVQRLRSQLSEAEKDWEALQSE